MALRPIARLQEKSRVVTFDTSEQVTPFMLGKYALTHSRPLIIDAYASLRDKASY